MSSIEHLVALMQEEEEERPDLGEKSVWWEFWDWVDEDRLEYHSDESSNQVMSFLGLAIESASAIFVIITILRPLWMDFSGDGVTGIGWWEWGYGVICLLDLLLIIWGWVKFFDYFDNPSPETTFRAWRVNWLSGSVNIAV